jgi:sulfite dehydrogenase (quinone) subunit SoeC
MHPAYSVILFTTASGAGYGLLVWLALARLLALLPAERGFGLTAFGLAFGLITAGLLSSTAHLGRPERAWRAFSQWRTSWLSREGVLALATYIPSGFLALAWTTAQERDPALLLAALLTAITALMTLFSTGMIYASLRTIRQWHQPLTAPVYVALGLASGAVLLNLIVRAFGFKEAWVTFLAIGALSIAGILKWAYWRRSDGELRSYTVEAATGIGQLGKVRPLEPPHTEPNYIMREMGYRIARKHAKRLRQGVGIFLFAAPIAGCCLAFLPLFGLFGSALAGLALAAGLFIERWLFFAEAEHVVMLYYGADVA